MTDDSPAQVGLLSLVVPVFNEQESLPQLVAEIDAVVASLPGWRHEIVFVDDGSTDGSWNAVRELAEREHIRGLRFRRNFGKAAALNAGFAAARGEIVLTLDADLQDDPVEIPRFLEAIKSGKDVVSGFKQVRHDPWHKVFPSRVFNWMVSTVTRVKLHDHNCGFKAYRAAVVKEVRLYGELHRYVPVLAAARGFTVGELVVHHRARKFGQSKYGWKRFLKGFLDLVQVRVTTEFGWRPMHLFGTVAFLCWAKAAAAAVLAAVLLTFVGGWAGTFFGVLLLVVAGVSGVFGGQCFMSGLLAELQAARREDAPFVVSETTGNEPGTAAVRRYAYLLIGAVAVFVVAGKIVGGENVIEPSRYAPSPGSFDADRPDKPVRKWPSARPEPSPFYSSNDKSRWATIRALVDDGTYVVGKRANFTATVPPFDDTGIIFEPEYTSLDKVMNPDTGDFYSSKPPLYSTVLAGEYWLLKRAFGWDMERDRWPVTCAILLSVNVIPFAVYLWLLAKLIDRTGRTDFGRLFAFTLAACGTFLVPFGMTLNNHSPAAYCVVFAIYPLLRKDSGGGSESPAELATSGFFAGLTACLDLPAAALTAALLVPLVYTRPLRTLAYFVPPLLVPVAAFFACNYAAIGQLKPAYSEFGGPWYEYGGSHWYKLKRAEAGEFVPGIDFAQEPKGVYAFHLLLGHHGWFSLTPAFLLSLGGLVAWAWQGRADVWRIVCRRVALNQGVFTPRLVGPLTLVVSAVVVGFFVLRTNNYGGNTSGPRWLFWLIPLWVLGAVPAADWAGKWRAGRVLAALVLGVSVLSVFYPAWNPWRSPWVQQLCERAGWMSYDVK